MESGGFLRPSMSPHDAEMATRRMIQCDHTVWESRLRPAQDCGKCRKPYWLLGRLYLDSRELTVTRSWLHQCLWWTVGEEVG